MSDLLVSLIGGLLILVGIILVGIMLKRDEQEMIEHTIELLNDNRGGDWYYDKSRDAYYDSLTTRVFRDI